MKLVEENIIEITLLFNQMVQDKELPEDIPDNGGFDDVKELICDIAYEFEKVYAESDFMDYFECLTEFARERLVRTYGPGNKQFVGTLFVLDFDGTYDCSNKKYLGIEPAVYYIPEEKIIEVQNCVHLAHEAFHKAENPTDLQEYFESFLIKKKVPFYHVGCIEIPFENRQVDYLADYIPREIV